MITFLNLDDFFIFFKNRYFTKLIILYFALLCFNLWTSNLFLMGTAKWSGKCLHTPKNKNSYFGIGIMRSNFMRSKFNFFMRSNFRSWGQNAICSWGRICPIISIRWLTLWSWDWNPNEHYYKFWSHDCSYD